MAFPLGTNGDLYNAITLQNGGRPPTLSQYNDGVRWVNAASGSNIPLFSESPGAVGTTSTQPPASSGLVVTGSEGAGTSEVMSNFEANWTYTLEQQAREDAAAMARQQYSSDTAAASAAATAQAQLEAQKESERGALERLRYQLGNDLASALMANDLSRAQLTLDVAGLAADPRSTVGFLEYLAHQGGGPTAVSQNLAAGMTPSPVWDYMPATEGYSPEVQALLTQLQGFIGG